MNVLNVYQKTLVVQQNQDGLIVSTQSNTLQFNAPGIAGPAGQGVPAGGLTNQILSKKSNSDFDTEWVDNQGLFESAEADESIKKGQVVYIKVAGHLGLAQANDPLKQGAAGLAYEDKAATFSCRYITDSQLELEDWTEVIGSEELSIGSVYYLDPSNAGMLTTTAPTTVGQYVVKVGRALSSNILDIEIAQGILL